MIRHLILTGVVLFSVTACQAISSPSTQELAIASPTVPIVEIPVIRATPTFHLRQLPTREIQATPTLSPEPAITPTAATKPYLIRHDRGAGDGVDEVAICLSYHPDFILYEDGQLLFDTSDGLVETELTDTEIQDLLTQIAGTGFFEVEESEAGIYDLPQGLEHGEGGWGEGITVRGKSIWVTAEIAQYAVKAVKDTLAIVKGYQPLRSVKPYIPDTISLFVLDMTSEYFPVPTPLPPVPEWPDTLPPLQLSWSDVTWDRTVIESAFEMRVFPYFPSVETYSQAGVNYFVIACPSLP